MCSPGYTLVMPWQALPLEAELPVCQPGDAFSLEDLQLLEKQTTPPDYLTEAELITLMEKHGIGNAWLLPSWGRDLQSVIC